MFLDFALLCLQSFARFSLWMLRICSMAMVQKCVPQGHFGVGAGRTDSPYLRVLWCLCFDVFFPNTSMFWEFNSHQQFCHFGIHLLTFRLSRRSRGGFTPPDSQSGPKPGGLRWPLWLVGCNPTNHTIHHGVRCESTTFYRLPCFPCALAPSTFRQVIV